MKLKIGLELHIQLNIETKLFSISKNENNDNINNDISSFVVGTPGSMPSLNKKAVNLGVRLALLLNSKITDKLYFDRKNYFYHDSPKGFQITQFYKPLASGGFFKFILKNNEFKKINIKSIILEEDTASSKTEDGNLYVNYNRNGTGLIELVTEPDFNSTEEVEFFLKSIFRTLKKTKISKCKFSLGNVRVDVNVSVYENEDKKTNIVEIKNLNKFENIISSIKEEFKIQKDLLLMSLQNKRVTKKFDEKLKKLVLMREKMTEENYFFIPENNILPINLSDETIKKEIEFIKKINFPLEKDFINKFNLNYEDKELILKKEYFFKLFLDIFPNKYENKKKIINYFKSILFLFNDKDVYLKKEFVLKILKKELNNKQMLEVTKRHIEDFNFDVNKYLLNIKELEEVYSKKDLECFCLFLLETDFKLIEKYKKQPETTLKYIMGQIMKWSHKTVNPKKTMKIIKDYFNELII